MSTEKLTLIEELLLISLDDRKGTVSLSASAALPYGLAGAALLELLLAGRIGLDADLVVPRAKGTTGDERLDEMLGALRVAPKQRSATRWISRFGRSSKKLKRDTLQHLVRRGVLTEEQGRILWVFPIRRYPQSNAGPEQEVRARVRAVLKGTKRADDRTLALIGLLHACNLVARLFDKEERREAKRRAKEIAAQEPLGQAVAQVIAGVRAATAAAAASAASAAS